MIIAIILFVIAIAIIAFLQEDEGFVIISMFIVLIWSLAAPALYRALVGIEYKEKPYAEIYSLETTVGSSGHFTLGSGTITQGVFYFYYTENDGFLKINKIQADNCLIKETDEIKPCITIKTEPKVKKMNYWFRWSEKCMIYEEQFIIYVPVGTVIQYYNGNIN